MFTVNAQFIKSAADFGGFYSDEGKKQIAVAGKSNVGKSSFINMLANRNRLAKTSQTPGHTRLINYFDFGEFILTDLPGYGYAKVSRTEQGSWSGLIDSYLTGEPTLAHVIMLVDIRHDPTKQDILLTQYLYSNMLPFSIVATKSDKLSRAAIKPRLASIAGVLKVGQDNIIAVSSTAKAGREEIFELIRSKI